MQASTLGTMRKLILLGLFLLAGVTFVTGINWGLPSNESDAFLFGNRTPWTGDQIMKLAGPWDTAGTRGADIAMHPVDNHAATQPVELNDTDAKRAEIVRRYRLYSNQPDEMITFRSLSRMKPGKLDLDPRMYQYGGLWIYPIGLFLKAGAALGLITLRTDLAFYLDNPAAFARFYLLARIYSASWGLLGVIVVFALATQWSGQHWVGICAAAVYSTMPVVINLAHEAKPHLPGAVLILLCIWAAMRYVENGNSRWWILTGLFAGAAMGMVLTGYVAFFVIPTMMLLRPVQWRERIRITVFATLIGVAVFITTNPYLPLNLLGHRAVLDSNIGNYGTFYQPKLSIDALFAAANYLQLGTSPGPAILAVFALLVVARLRKARGWLLAIPGIVVLIQFVLLAQDKTAEYARFALLPDVLAAILCAVLINCLKFRQREKSLLAACLITATLYFGLRYDINYLADNRADSTRRYTAQVLEAMKQRTGTLAMTAEPAPYCLPPVDLFTWRILLLPKHAAAPAGVVQVKPSDSQTVISPQDQPVGIVAPPGRLISPLSWANKPFEIFKKGKTSSTHSSHPI